MPSYPRTTSPRVTIPEDGYESEKRGLRYDNPRDIPVSPGGEIEDEAIERKDGSGKARSVPN